jgi:hypothetical protein
MGMPGIFELLILGGACFVPVVIIVVIAVLANIKRK